MSINHILETAGTSIEDLDNAVSNYRRMTEQGHGQAPLEAFDIESHATTIEQLAHRLSTIYSMVEPLLAEDGPQSLLARAIVGEIAPSNTSATNIVRTLLNPSPEIDPDGDVPGVILNERPIYGHPQLRHVIHGVFDHEARALVVTAYIVDPVTGESSHVLQDERPAQAAIRVTSTR